MGYVFEPHRLDETAAGQQQNVIEEDEATQQILLKAGTRDFSGCAF